MRKVIALLALAFVVACGSSDAQVIGGGVGVHNHSSNSQGGTTLSPSTVTLSGTLSSTKACAGGYTRFGPNLCMRNQPGITTFTDGICQSITNPSADSRVVLVKVQYNAYSGNAINPRQSVLTLFDDSACAGNVNETYVLNTREEVAVVAGTTLATQELYAFLRPATIGTNAAIRTDVTNGTSGAQPQFRIMGYYD